MTQERDEFHGLGGSYELRNGKRVRVEEATKDHPEGNRARGADGRPVVFPEDGRQPPAATSEGAE